MTLSLSSFSRFPNAVLIGLAIMFNNDDDDDDDDDDDELSLFK